MSKRYVERCSALLEIDEVQVKTTVRANVGEECRADGNVSGTTILENSLM